MALLAFILGAPVGGKKPQCAKPDFSFLSLAQSMVPTDVFLSLGDTRGPRHTHCGTHHGTTALRTKCLLRALEQAQPHLKPEEISGACGGRSGLSQLLAGILQGHLLGLKISQL